MHVVIADQLSSSAIEILRTVPGFTGSPVRVCVITGESAGSTAIALNEGLRARITSTHPEMVPPVPTPATNVQFGGTTPTVL